MIDNCDRIAMYVEGNAQSVLIGFLGQSHIHDKTYWTELDVYSNLHQLMQKKIVHFIMTKD